MVSPLVSYWPKPDRSTAIFMCVCVCVRVHAVIIIIYISLYSQHNAVPLSPSVLGNVSILGIKLFYVTDCFLVSLFA